MSIRRKYIRLILLLFACIVVFVALFSIYLDKAQDRLADKQSELRKKAEIVDMLEETVNRVFFHARGYYAFHLSSELENTRDQLALFDSLIDQFSALPLTESERKIRDEIRAFHTSYTTEFLPKTVALVQSGDVEELRQFASADGIGTITDFLSFAKTFREHADSELNRAFLQTIDQSNRFMTIAFLFSGGILLVFVLLMWRILRDIVRPLSDLSGATEALIHGQNVRLGYSHRKDEIGRLSASFNHMVRSIQDKEEELTAQNEELTMQQEELQSNQERLQRSLAEIESMTKALDQSSAVAILDEHGVFKYVNDKLCEWTQYKPAQLLGKSYRILFPSRAAASEWDEIANVTGTGGIWSGDMEHRGKDGADFWMQSTLVPYVNGQGAVYQYILIGNDISEVKRTQARLVESLEQTEKTKETLERHNRLNHALTYTLDKQEFADAFLRHINELYTLHTSLFLLTADRVVASRGIGADTLSLFKNESMTGLYERLSQEKSFVVRREADGAERGIAQESKVWCCDFYSGVFNARDEMTALFCATRIGSPFHAEEISGINGLMNRVSLALERIMMFDEIGKAQKLNQDIMNNVNEGIQFVDPDGCMLQSNEALCRMVRCDDFTKADRVDKDVWISRFVRAGRDGEALERFFNNALANASDAHHSLRYVLEGETPRYMEVYATSVFQRHEKIGTIFVHRDMTREHELDQMKSELVSTVSHELRTPLSSVLGFAELLLSRELKPERRQKYVETIHKEAKRLTNLINDFLDLQRMESGNQQYVMESCALDKLAMETANHFKHERRHQAVFLDEARDVRVQADKERMMQVLTNMMSNAVKFSPEGGRITLRLTNDAENVVLSIRDEGIGIPRDELPKLFQKFKRIDNSASRNVGGTGLGLVICKEIIAKHNGSIWIESEEGAGTTIFFSLPLLHPPSVHPLAEEPHAEKTDRACVNVMIVEDDTSLALLLSEELKMKGFRVIHHYHPGSALEDALKTPLVGIVIDLMLGDDMDGWDLIKELKNHPETAGIPIVVSSALDRSEEKIQRFNIAKYLTKPYPSGELSKVIMEFFSRMPPSGEIAFPEDRAKG